MARIPDAFIDELLARSDIVEIVGARVPLKKQGREYSARCPFHDERSPSFTVSPTKQFYHCFGCGAHGTAISFLMNYDRLEFLDAVDELAKRAGLEVPRDTRQRNEDGDTRDIFSALDAANAFFRRQLAQSGKARDYVAKRGIDAQIVERYGIGYAPDGFSALRDALGTDPRRMQLLERGGLFSKNDKGHVYDKFRDRLMFPIHDRRGRVIAFGGRVIDPEDSPKYLNSPETALFHKGRELYGLWQAKQANTRLERLVVVEGYMDVVALAQYGVSQAVATLGTATTPEHAELLFRNAPDVFFCFDGDRAGRQAAWKALESVLPRMKDGRQAFFLFLPEGEDPDTLIRQEGSAGFEQRLVAATPLSEFFFAHQELGTDLRTADGRARLAERCKEMIAGIPEGAFRDRMQEILTDKTAIRWSLAASLSPQMREGVEEMLEERVAQLRGTPTRTTEAVVAAIRPAQSSDAQRSVVRYAVSLLLQNPTFIESVKLPPYAFADLRRPGIALLIELLDFCRARPSASTAALLQHYEEREDGAALRKLAVLPLHGDAGTLEREFIDALNVLGTQTAQQRADDLVAKQRESGLDEAEKIELRGLLATLRR